MTAGTKTTITPRGRVADLRPARGLIGFGVMLVAALLAVAALFFIAEGEARAQTAPLAEKIVVIDPGHGGSDLGATYTFQDRSRITEKEQNLDVAYRLKALLEDPQLGAKVHMTREYEWQNPTNTQRAQFANEKKADVLVSIHMNGSKDPKVDYTTTLFGKWQKDKQLALVMYGKLTKLPAAKTNDSDGDLDGRTPYSYASGVLLKSNMPATIAETVFITNNEEAAWLKYGRTINGTSVCRQQQIAEALKTGVEAHLTKK